MPELPEVESLARYLEEQAKGKTIARVDVAAISALKTFDPQVNELVGKQVTGTGRRGKFILIAVEDIWLVMHLARGGWIRWSDNMRTTPIKPGKGPMALRVRFDDGSGFDVTEAGTEKRLAVYVVRDPQDIEFLATLGPDPLDEAFDATAFAELLREKGGGSQIKKVLTDQRIIAGIGNAYSDDALNLAKLSPFKTAGKLTDDESQRLYDAIRTVLTDAVQRSLGLPAAGLKSEKKSGMRVHGRTGQPCPECGDTVREVSFATKSLQYCATCQTGGKPLADRRLSRLLK